MSGPHGEQDARTADLDGPLHYVDFGGPAGGPAGGPTVVLVHGLGGSHLNWELMAPALARHARVLAVDLPGFGLSEPGHRPATVPANVRVLERFVREVVGGPVILVGNSMGGMISILVAAHAPELVNGLTLVDPALPPTPRGGRNPAVAAMFGLYALPGVGERVIRSRRRRYGAEAVVNATLRLCGVDPAALPPDLLARSVAIVEQRGDVAGMDRAFISAARSLLWVLARAPRYWAAMAAIRVPVLLVHGERDRLVPVAAAREAARRNPGWRYVELPAAGHVPQLQVPGELTGRLLEWLADSGVESGSARA